MTRRWAIWTIGILLLAMVALFPLRVALGLSDLERIGFTARQVSGTVWYGRIGELQLRSQNVGSYEVALSPLALLTGAIDMKFDRLESIEGPFTGRLIAGRSRGVIDANGRIGVGTMFAPLPISALAFEEATVLFRDGRCAEASGRVRPVLATFIPGIEFDPNTAGTISCDGERARVEMRSRSGRETIDFYVSESGRYRGWITVRAAQPIAAAALTLLGFQQSAEGLVLTVEGQL